MAGPAASDARAQGWVNLVFPNRDFNFGTVAKYSKVHHSFKVVNTLDKEIHIVTFRPKCGCTDVKLGATTIPPGTQTVIEAVVDTTKFVGHKESGLTLVIDRPAFQEIDFRLTCFIRGDLTLSPGEVQFGVVNRASAKPGEMSLVYSGAAARLGRDEDADPEPARHRQAHRAAPVGRGNPGHLRPFRHAQPVGAGRHPQGRDHALHQRPDQPDHPDLRLGRGPVERDGHALGPGDRTGPRQRDDRADRAGPIRAAVPDRRH